MVEFVIICNGCNDILDASTVSAAEARRLAKTSGRLVSSKKGVDLCNQCQPPNPPNKRFEATGVPLQVEPGNWPDASNRWALGGLPPGEYYMIKYVVFSDESSLSLAERVNRVLNEESGWELQGGASCALSENYDFRYTLFAQALVKKSAQQDNGADAEQAARSAEEKPLN